MRVRVDEPRRHHVPRGVDHARRRALQAGPDGGDVLALDGEVRPLARGPAAVDEGPALDQQRPGHDYSSTMATVVMRLPA